MFRTLSEILTRSELEGTGFLVVEGQEDKRFYQEQFVSKRRLAVEVWSVDTVDVGSVREELSGEYGNRGLCLEAALTSHRTEGVLATIIDSDCDLMREACVVGENIFRTYGASKETYLLTWDRVRLALSSLGVEAFSETDLNSVLEACNFLFAMRCLVFIAARGRPFVEFKKKDVEGGVLNKESVSRKNGLSVADVEKKLKELGLEPRCYIHKNDIFSYISVYIKEKKIKGAKVPPELISVALNGIVFSEVVACPPFDEVEKFFELS